MTGLRLCFISPEYALHPPFGGIATYTRDTARWLVANGHQVHVVLVSRTCPPGTEDDNGVKVHLVPPQRIRPRRILRYAAQVPGLRSLYEAYAGWNLLEDSLGAWRAIRGLSPRAGPFDVIEAADTFGLGFWGPANRFRRTPILIRSHGYADPSLLGRNWPGMQFQLALERFSTSPGRLRPPRLDRAGGPLSISLRHCGISNRAPAFRDRHEPIP